MLDNGVIFLSVVEPFEILDFVEDSMTISFWSC